MNASDSVTRNDAIKPDTTEDDSEWEIHVNEDGSESDYEDAFAEIPYEKVTADPVDDDSRSKTLPDLKKRKTENEFFEILADAAAVGRVKLGRRTKRRVIVLESTLDCSKRYFPTISRCLQFLGVANSKYYQCLRSGDPCNGWYIAWLDVDLETGELFKANNVTPAPRFITLTKDNRIKKFVTIGFACNFLKAGMAKFHASFREEKDIKGWKIESCSLSGTEEGDKLQVSSSPHTTPLVAEKINFCKEKVLSSDQNHDPLSRVPSAQHSQQAQHRQQAQHPQQVQYPAQAQHRHQKQYPPPAQPQFHWPPTFCSFPGCYQDYLTTSNLKAHIRHTHSADELLEQYITHKDLLAKMTRDATEKQTTNDTPYGNSAFNQWDFTYPNFGETLAESPAFKLGAKSHFFKISFGSTSITDKFRALTVTQLDSPTVAVHVEVKLSKLVSNDNTNTTEAHTLLAVNEVQETAGEETEHLVKSKEVDNFGKSIVLLRVEATISLIFSES
eukprot:m.65370 g.65370  ORF g.65370 m.65370 type:complete len:501 (-) comp11729_c1_seq2:77-1579(-)